MKPETIVLFERGINGFQSIWGEWHNWPNQAIAWTHKNTPHKAQTLLYFTSPIFAGLTRRWRAKQLSELIRTYSIHDWRIIAACHSEGTATWLKAQRLAGWPRVEALHLICGACNADFEKNGLNWALRIGAVGKVHVYIAGKDEAMWAENTWLGKLLFDLPRRSRPLGLVGPQKVDENVSDRVVVHQNRPWSGYGHSDCWSKANFESTMRQLIPA